MSRAARPQFRCIYADPGWQYRNTRTGGSHKSGSAQHYRTLSLEQLQALPIPTLAHDEGACLFLWVTVPMLEEGLATLNAWGFKYKNATFWDKQRYGMGYWTRGQVEPLLFGIRKRVPAFRSSLRNITEHSTRHSAKPASARKGIEQVVGAFAPDRMSRVELFARDKVDGWSAWGDEIDSDIVLAHGIWSWRASASASASVKE